SGMAFYASDVFAPWRHKLFIGALKDKEVIVMRVDGNTVTEEGPNYPAVTVCSSSDKRIRIKVGLPPFSTIAHRPGIKRKRRCLP
ncbi:PQQ-dependent sugar dehydrogenase, partial [Salmonella enterica subsp. enterica serovar Montevideo]|nr:PQQ-dependent sugar dehydrogenase [Salmonella enterica subsp. enterica serovar Montevideo]